VTRAVADTSLFIAVETGRTVATDRIPDEVSVSVVTVAELETGVLTAPDTAARAVRLRTLERAVALAPIPIDNAVAATWARLRASLAEAGRRVHVNDLWIASTAATAGTPVLTQDDDFDVLAELGLVDVIKL
jgi:predicted nucleic acid-binding protein